MYRVLIVALTAITAGCAGVNRLDLTTLGRATWQRPDDVIAALEVEPGDRVADLGAGEGFFLPALAEAVGPRGRVYAVEVEDALAESLQQKFAARSNIEVVRGRTDDPLLPDGAIDLVLIVNTYHHIDGREEYFAALRTDLSPRGRVAVVEPDGDLTGVLSLFLDEGHTSRASEVAREMGAAGYRRVARYDLLPIQIFEVFAREPQ